MSEHDSTWASGASDDRVAGQSPPREHDQRQESTPIGDTGDRPAETPTTARPAGSGHPVSGPAAGQPTAAQPTVPYQHPGGYPTPGSPYQAPGSPYQAPGSPYQAPGNPYQRPGVPYGTSEPGGQPGAPGGHPGTPYPGAPAWATTSTTPTAKSGSGLARGAVVAVAAVALALCSGVAGGLVTHQLDGDGPVQTVTRNAAPVVDRSSVAAVAAAVQPSVVDITTGSGEGSGVVISADGAILTNNHVIEGARGNTVEVTFSSGKSAKATIVGADPSGDLAVVKAQGVSGLTAAKFGDSDAVQVGDTVLALGSPLGLQGSVTAGIVSALHRTIDEGDSASARGSIGDAIQTDAAINPGNSGGALVNLAGEVIGINTAILTSGQGASGNIGVGFAISSNVAKSTADQLLKGGKVSHPYAGVQVGNGDGGALIADVVSGGPADKAGLRKGDLVTKVGSRAVTDSRSLVAAIRSAKPGDQLAMTVVRNGAEQQITITLGEAP
ncbi:trypsin-like peptidase domain-containing protein [Planosporangium sp. 12N6]|uniref:S1C family serine protease n=1 Tax=Planosporangium spinosum TaxID=3402278 RepID=UPI003CE6F4B7